MNIPIVSSPVPITLIGAGLVTIKDIIDARNLAETLVAADGGANAAVANGHIPDATIGDLDSLNAATMEVIRPASIHAVAEQDNTDFEKALLRIDAPLIIAIGFAGRRIDHQLAALHALVRFAHQPIILLNAHEVVCHTPPNLTVPVDIGAPVSLFPLRPVTGASTGLKWPINGLTLEPGTQISTSNEASAATVELRVNAPGLLSIFPRRNLADLVTSLQACDAWPAPSRALA